MEGENKMSFKVSSNPNHSMQILEESRGGSPSQPSCRAQLATAGLCQNCKDTFLPLGFHYKAGLQTSPVTS